MLDNHSDNDNDSNSDIDNDNDSDSDSDKDKNKVKTVTYRLKFIDSYWFMQGSLSSLVDNLSEINNKEPKNKFTDNIRSMVFSLTQWINKISEIDRKISQIDKKETENNLQITWDWW